MAVGDIKTSNKTGLFSRPQKVAFLLFDGLSMVALASAIEPLRLANRVSGQTLFEWETYSLDGAAVVSSSCLSITPDLAFTNLHKADIVLICTGAHVERLDLSPLLGIKLRTLSAKGAILGSLCTGSYVLAKLKLLDNYRCTIHWESMRAFREQFPHVNITNDVFEIDRDRMSCAGGTTALDMMLAYIAHIHSLDLARQIAEINLHQAIREGKEEQRYDLESRLGISNRLLIEAIAVMDDHIEDPVSCQQIAEIVNISSRQLERLFRKHFQTTPGQYYQRLRLMAARDLLRQTNRSILDISIAVGFASTSHFTKCFRDCYGHTPTTERQMSIWKPNMMGQTSALAGE